MKREIKFRGLDYHDKWVIGLPHYMTEYAKDNSEIDGIQCELTRENHDVDYLTVGQYTGLKDKNGKEIYEGDIVEGIESGYEIIPNIDEPKRIGQVVHSNGNTYYKVGNQIHQLLMYLKEIEVIGDIHQNHELLK